MKLEARVTIWIALLSVIATASARWLGVAEGVVADCSTIDDLQVWRLFTGPLVHATWAHLLRDMALLVFVGLAFERELGRRYALLCLLGLGVPTVAALWDPTIYIYYGTSGLTHALLAAAITHTLLARHPDFRTPAWMRGLAALGGLALVTKVLWEVAFDAPLFPMDLGAGVRQLPSAHALGAAVGILFVAGSLLVDKGGWQRPTTARPLNSR